MTIENGEYSVACQEDNYITETIRVKEGDSLCVRHISASGYQEQVTTVVTLAEQKFSFISMTKVEPVVSLESVVSLEPVITSEAVSTPESVTEPMTEPVTTPATTIEPVPVTENINTVAEQKTSAGSMMWLLLFGLVKLARISLTK